MEVRLDTEVDAALVAAESPDVVIWAAGGEMCIRDSFTTTHSTRLTRT